MSHIFGQVVPWTLEASFKLALVETLGYYREETPEAQELLVVWWTLSNR